MKLKSCVVFLLFFIISSIHASETNKFIGGYELEGVMEVAGFLSLKPDGTYVASFSYGAADWLEVGNWKNEGDTILIQSNQIKGSDWPETTTFLKKGSRFDYKPGKLSSTNLSKKMIFVDPNKTPTLQSSKGELKCLSLDSQYRYPQYVSDGSLISVEKNKIVVESDIPIEGRRPRKDISLRKSWAEKNIPSLINPPKLYQHVQGNIQESDVICIQDISSGEGRMRVRGKLVKLDSEYLTIQMGSCHKFIIEKLPTSVLQLVKEKKVGEVIDVEIPYSSGISDGSCPTAFE